MPVVRINNEGVEVEQLKVIQRRKNAKKASVVVVLGMIGSAVVYNSVSPEAGIFFALWPVAIASLLNLYSE